MATNTAGTQWLDEQKEAGLVQLARQGNRQAFLALADHYERPLYRLAFALTRRRDDAEQITEETFVRAWAGMSGIPDGKRFFPWVLRMARNLSVAHARRRAGEPIAPPAADGELDPRDAREEHRLREALRDLRPDEQMAIALRVVERLRYETIATWLDHPIGVTLARLSTARGFLLSKEEKGEDGEASES